jgi:hypothetical protein
VKIEPLHYHGGKLIGAELGYGPSRTFPTERHWQFRVFVWDRGFWIYLHPTKRETERAMVVWAKAQQELEGNWLKP